MNDVIIEAIDTFKLLLKDMERNDEALLKLISILIDKMIVLETQVAILETQVALLSKAKSVSEATTH
jgi:hypothetical protein